MRCGALGTYLLCLYGDPVLFVTLTVIVLSARYRMLFIVSVPMGSISVKSVMMAMSELVGESVTWRP